MDDKPNFDDDRLTRIEHQLDKICRMLDGGSEWERGLMTRVDHLEQRWKIAAVIIGGASSIVGAAIATVSSWRGR